MERSLGDLRIFTQSSCFQDDVTTSICACVLPSSKIKSPVFSLSGVGVLVKLLKTGRESKDLNVC